MVKLFARLLVTGITLLALGAGGLAYALDRPHCEICGRSWIDSPCRIKFSLSFGKHERSYYVCSPECYCELMEDHSDKEPEVVLVNDYSEGKEIHPMMYNVNQMSFLIGIAGDEEKNHPPFVGAFPLESQAKDAQKTLGGELADWKAVLKRCKKVADEEEPERYEGPPPLGKRKRSKD